MFDDYLRSILLYFISKLYVQKVKDSNNEAIEHQIYRLFAYSLFHSFFNKTFAQSNPCDSMSTTPRFIWHKAIPQIQDRCHQEYT